MNPSGDAAVVWRSADLTLEAATRERGGPWVPHGDISQGEDPGWGLQVEMDSAGNAYVVWLAVVTNNRTGVHGATYRPGLGWTPPADITGPSPANQQFWNIELAVDSQGSTASAATAIWEQYDSDSTQFNEVQSSTLATGGYNAWSPPQVVSRPDTRYSWTYPNVGMDAAGNATAVWHGLGSGSVPQIWTATRAPGAQAEWTDHQTISPPDWSTDYLQVPAISVNQAGEATAAWTSEEPVADTEGVWAATRSDGVWTPAQMLRSTDPGQSFYTKVAIDRDGAATAAWKVRVGGPDPEWTVEVSERPPGGAWSAHEVVSGDTGYLTTLSLADPFRSAYRPQLTWSSHEDGPNLTMGIRGATRTTTGDWARSILGPAASEVEVAGDGQGNGVAVIAETRPDDPGEYDFAKAVGYDDAGPAIDSVDVPSRGYVGEPVTFSVERTDVWSKVASDLWDFGDGDTGSGQQVTHTYTEPGTYEVSITTTDSLGHPTTSSGHEIEILVPGKDATHRLAASDDGTNRPR